MDGTLRDGFWTVPPYSRKDDEPICPKDTKRTRIDVGVSRRFCVRDVKWCTRQEERPGSLWMKIRFMDGLNADLVNKMADHGYTVRRNSLQQLVDAASQLEEAKDARPAHAKSKTMSSSSGSKPAALPARRPNGQFRPGTRPVQRPHDAVRLIKAAPNAPQKGRAPGPSGPKPSYSGLPRRV